MKCLATKRTTRSEWNSDFNQIIQAECSDEVFPLMRAAAMSCGCELNAMTTAHVRAVKQAWLEDINIILAAVKASIKSVKVEEAAGDSLKMAFINERFSIMKNWYFFIYLNKVPVEGEDVEHAAITTPQRQSKRARTATALAE